MDFTEAVQLASAIRERGDWYVLEVGAASGEKLEDDRWSVTAICTLHWNYIHYWNRPGSAAKWPSYVESWEKSTRIRASSHEQYPIN